MQYIHSDDFRVEQRTVVTLGKFDGVHRGHQRLLEIVKDESGKRNADAVVFTFDHFPPSIFPVNQKYIMTNLERKNTIREFQPEYLIEYPFTREFMNTEPEDFVRDVLVGRLNVSCVVVGTDFTFGRERRGTPQVLEELGGTYGFDTIIVEKERYEDRDISSTYIREELCVGHMETVNMLMGRPYSVNGIVAGGNQLGRSMGLPTINIYPPIDKLLPPNGVYASVTHVGGDMIRGVTNVGVKPTVSDTGEVSVETFLFDFDGELYGKKASVDLRHFQRPETRFESQELLRKQIMSDVEFARELFLL
jgi:riboflavin kinase/FMN adenylyltransferase